MIVNHRAIAIKKGKLMILHKMYAFLKEINFLKRKKGGWGDWLFYCDEDLTLCVI